MPSLVSSLTKSTPANPDHMRSSLVSSLKRSGASLKRNGARIFALRSLVGGGGELDGRPLKHWDPVLFEGAGVSDPAAHNEQGDDFWRENLTEKQRYVMREGGTERPRTSALNEHFPEFGYYACRGCGNAVYTVEHKFESWCGWPAFGRYIKKALETRLDTSLGWSRMAVSCKRCKCHLGHVFRERNGEYTERHCINGVAIKYVKESLQKQKDISCTVFR